MATATFSSMRPAAWHVRHGELLAAALLLLVYVAALSWMPKKVFWHPDEGAKFLGMRALGWGHGLTYDVPYPGRVIDPAFDFYAGRCRGGEVYPLPQLDGSLRLRWPIWFPLASRPFFDAFGVRGVYVLPLLCGWLGAVVAGRWMALAGSRLGPLTILLIGCGTPVLFYSLCFSEHTLATFAGVVATSILIAAPRPGWRTVLQMAPFLLVAIALRVELLALAVALAVAGAGSWAVQRVHAPERRALALPRRLRWWRNVIVGGVAVVAILAVAALLSSRQQQDLLRLPDLFEANLRKVPYLPSGIVRLLIGRVDNPGPLRGPTGQVAILLSIGAAALAPFMRSRRAEAILIFGALGALLVQSLAIALASRAFLDRQGMLGVAPYMVVGGYAVPYAWRERNYGLLRLACAASAYGVLGCVALFTFRINEWGDELLGLDGSARYMLTLYPMGAVLSLVGMQAVRASDRSALVKSAFTILVTAMVILSLVYEFRGLREMRANKNVLVAWEGALRTQARVVSDVWWLPAVLAPLSTTHEMYCVDDPRAFPGWVARARAAGAKSFAFCTPGGVDVERFRYAAPDLIADAAQTVRGLRIQPFHFKE